MPSEAIRLTADGVELPALLFQPDRSEAAGPQPGVVVAPGGLGRGDPAAYRWAGERLAAAGYQALMPSYRAASPYDDVSDLRLALDRQAQDDAIDRGRLVLLGHSRGGLAALRTAAEDARVRAVVAIAAPVDLAHYVEALTAFAPAAREGVVRFMGGEPKDIPERYRLMETSLIAERMHVPVLLIHGTADMRVPVEHARRLETALRDAGTERVRLEMVDGMGHFLELGTLGYQFDRVIALATAWLAEVLPV